MTSAVYRKHQEARQQAQAEELDARFKGKVVSMPAKKEQTG
jgi:hypothetical protein